MTKTVHPAVPALAVVAALLYATAARADEAAGVALFEEAKQLVEVGDYARACPKIAEAQRLFPTAAKLLSLGNCYEQIDRLASSWAAFKEAEIMARGKADAEREQEGARRAGLLAPRLAKLAIVVPPAARVPGFELRRDGELVGEGQYGSAMPVDVGHHTIEATAPGLKAWSHVMRVDMDGSSTSVEVPVLEALAAGPGKAGTGFTWGGQRIGGVVLGGVGVAGGIAGVSLGIVALTTNSEAKRECSLSNPNFCNAAGASLRSTAITLGNGSTGTLVASGVLLAGGIVTFVTAPSGNKPTTGWVEVVPGLGTLAFRGTF
jgi:hypothetical protein